MTLTETSNRTLVASVVDRLVLSFARDGVTFEKSHKHSLNLLRRLSSMSIWCPNDEIRDAVYGRLKNWEQSVIQCLAIEQQIALALSCAVSGDAVFSGGALGDAAILDCRYGVVEVADADEFSEVGRVVAHCGMAVGVVVESEVLEDVKVVSWLQESWVDVSKAWSDNAWVAMVVRRSTGGQKRLGLE